MKGLCVKPLSFLALFALTNFSLVSADCPDFRFRCPTGESFTVGTCWSWRKWTCLTCRSITTEMKSKCRKFSCDGSVDNWYGRNDGCSAGFVSGAMTNVFRAACAIHDICYATPRRTKSQCDYEFYYNMVKTCRFPGIGSVAVSFCDSAARIAYLVVKDHGSNFPDFAKNCQEV